MSNESGIDDQVWKQFECPKCCSKEFGIDTNEDETGYNHAIYCKLCDEQIHSWSYPKPAAFGLKEE